MLSLVLNYLNFKNSIYQDSTVLSTVYIQPWVSLTKHGRRTHTYKRTDTC